MDRLQDFADSAFSLGRKALLPLVLGVAACAPDEVTEPSGGGSGEVNSTEDDGEISNFTSLNAADCAFYLDIADSNPNSGIGVQQFAEDSDRDGNISPDEDGLDSAWEQDDDGNRILAYDEKLSLTNADDCTENKFYACVTWLGEDGERPADNSDLLREDGFIYVSAETPASITDQVNGLVLQLMVDTPADRNDLRFVTIGGEDEVSRIVDQNADDEDEEPVSY